MFRTSTTTKTNTKLKKTQLPISKNQIYAAKYKPKINPYPTSPNICKKKNQSKSALLFHPHVDHYKVVRIKLNPILKSSLKIQ